MKAEELRFGNWLQTKKFKSAFVVKNYIGITTIGGGRPNDDWDDFDPFIDDVEPIPLTVEWLNKFGFTTQTVNEQIDCLNYWGKDIDASVDVFCDNTPFIFEYRVCERQRIKTIRFVHELQNLYHALTGKELTLE